MRLSIVSTAERPDLAALSARWRWEAFFQNTDYTLEEVVAAAERLAREAPPMPRTWMLLLGDEPIGTASITDHDLDERPDLTPWLAGVYVVPRERGRGHARHLITAVEQAAARMGFPTLWLYTGTAEQVYARAGWRRVEPFDHAGRPCVLMRRDLPAPGTGPIAAA